MEAKVKGRIELIKVSKEFALMIDYAHNAMALESLLTTLKEYEPGLYPLPRKIHRLKAHRYAPLLSASNGRRRN